MTGNEAFLAPKEEQLIAPQAPLGDNPNPEPTGEQLPVIQNEPPADPADSQPKFSDDEFLSWAKTKSGREDINTIDELFKPKEIEVEKEVIKEVNPYADIMDEDTEQYLKFRKDTGRSRQEFEFIKTDFDTKPAIDLAIEKARVDSGMNLTKDQAIAYLERKLSVSLDDLQNIDIADEVELNAFVKPYKDELKSQKEKYLQPLENRPNGSGLDMEKYIVLEDGSYVPKEAVEKHKQLQDQQTQLRDQYLENNKASVNEVTEAKFKMVLDENGTQKEIPIDYTYSDDDRQKMLSLTNDTEKIVRAKYYGQDGKFNHTAFNEDMAWSDREFRGKAINAIANQLFAEFKESQRTSDNNIDFTRNSFSDKSRKSQAAVPAGQPEYGFGANFLKTTTKT